MFLRMLMSLFRYIGMREIFAWEQKFIKLMKLDFCQYWYGDGTKFLCTIWCLVWWPKISSYIKLYRTLCDRITFVVIPSGEQEVSIHEYIICWVQMYSPCSSWLNFIYMMSWHDTWPHIVMPPHKINKLKVIINSYDQHILSVNKNQYIWWRIKLWISFIHNNKV